MKRKMVQPYHKKCLLVLWIVLVLPFSYAANYGSGTYGTGVYTIGQTPAAGGGSAVVSPSVSSGGGSGGGGGIFSSRKIDKIEGGCTQDYDCGLSQYCFEKTCFPAECFNNSACKNDEVCHQYRCVKLFDVEIKEFVSPAKLGEFFDFTYLIKGMAEFNDDVIIHFAIEKDGTTVTSGQDVIYLASFEEKIKTTKLFLPSTVDTGVYTFSIAVTYGAYKAESFRTIEIILNDKGSADIKLISEEPSVLDSLIQWKNYTLIPFIASYMLIILMIIGLTGIILIVVIKKRTTPTKKKRKKRKKTYKEKIKNHIKSLSKVAQGGKKR